MKKLSFNVSGTCRLGVCLATLLWVLGTGVSGFAKAPTHAASNPDMARPPSPACSVKVSTGTIDGYGGANSELPLELEVIRSLGAAEFAAG